MTHAQADRLKDIIKDIQAAPSHPSLHVRGAHAVFTPFVWLYATRCLERILDTDNGREAHNVISAWHDRGMIGVAWYLVLKSPDLRIFYDTRRN